MSKKQDFRPLGVRDLQMHFRLLATTLQLAAFLALVFWTGCYDAPDGFMLTDKELPFAKRHELQ